MRSTIAARWGAILGRSQMTVTSTAAKAAASCPHQIDARGGGTGRTRRPASAGRSAENACRYRRRRSRRAPRRSAHAARHRHRNGRPGSAVRDPTPQIHHMIAGREGVDVEALADPDIALPRGEEPLGRGEVFAVVTFRLSSLPSTMSGDRPAASATAASSVSIRPVAARWAARIASK